MESQQYFDWQSVEHNTRRGSFTLFDKPGMARYGQPDHAATLLADELEVELDETVVLFNSGSGLPGLVAAHAGAAVTMVDANVVAVEAAKRAAEANGLAEYISVAANSPSSTPTMGGTFDQGDEPVLSARAADPAQPASSRQATPKFGARTTKPWVDLSAVLLPKGKAAALQSIWDAYQSLRSGGHFYLAGANGEGAKSYFRYAEQLFGPIAVRGYRKGCRVGFARKPVVERPLPKLFQEPWLAHNYFRQHEVMVDGHTLHVCSRPGVFSWDRLDIGTQALLNVLEIDPTDSILDLGCGSGILGAVAALRAVQGDVLLLDANANAVNAARQTLVANGIHNAGVEWSDCAAIVDDRTFDVVVTNPPFHQGKAIQYDVAFQFVRDAARLLDPGGRFYLVANRFIPYEAAIRQWVGHVDTIHEDQRFKVYLGRKM